MDDLDFDDVFQDDDEATAEHEVEDEDVKDSKDRVKKEIKDYSVSGTQEDADEEYDDMGKLTSEGKVCKTKNIAQNTFTDQIE
jgi:transcription initiation factor TFIIF subunit alpha